MLISAPAAIASMNCLVPDRAMVPRLLTKSSLVIPIPVSRMVSVLEAASGMISIFRFGSEPNASLSLSDSYRILSRASEEFEMSSLRKISLFEYTALMIRLINCEMSALNWKFSVLAASSGSAVKSGATDCTSSVFDSFSASFG